MSCLSKTENIEEDVEPVVTVTPVPAESTPEAEKTAEPTVEPVIIADTREANGEEVDQETNWEENSKDTVFGITETEYNQTYNEIEELMKILNAIIAGKDYNSWLEYLTAEYIQEMGDKQYLAEISELPGLKNRNIVLNDLDDYFYYVIIPSRARAELEKIVFIDNNHVKAYGTIYKKSAVLYYFVKIDEQWKISIR